MRRRFRSTRNCSYSPPRYLIPEAAQRSSPTARAAIENLPLQGAVMFPVRQKIRSKLLPILALAVSLPVVAQQADSAQPEPDAATTLHHIKTVFIIVMENHNWTGDGS